MADFMVRFRRPSDMMSLDFYFFDVERNGKTLSATPGGHPHVVVQLPAQYVAEQVHVANAPVASWLPSRTLAARKSQLGIDLKATLPMPYDAESILALLALPLTSWPQQLPDTADPTAAGPSAAYPATFLELSHNLVLSPYAGARLRARKSPANAGATDLWTVVLNGDAWTGSDFTDHAKMRAVKSRDADAFDVTLTTGDRKQLVALTNMADPLDRAVHSDGLRLSPLGASGQMVYDQQPPGGYDLVLWRKELGVGRDVFEKVSYRGYLWPWMLPAIYTKTTTRRFYNAQDGVPDAATSLLEQFEVSLKGWEAGFDDAPARALPWTRVVADRAFTTTGSIDRDDIATVRSTAGVDGPVFVPLKNGAEFGFPLTLFDRDGNAQRGPQPAIFVPDFSGVPNGGNAGGNDPASFNAAFAVMSDVWKNRPRGARLAAAPERQANVAAGAVRWIGGALLRCIKPGITAVAMPEWNAAAGDVQYIADGDAIWHAVTAALGDVVLHDAPVSFVPSGLHDVALPTLTVTLAAPTTLNKQGLIAAAAGMVKAAVTIPTIRDLGDNPYVAIELDQPYIDQGFGLGEVFAKVRAANPSITGLDPSSFTQRPVLAFPTAGFGGLSRKIGAVLANVNDAAALEKCLDQARGAVFDPKSVFEKFKGQLPTLFGFINLKDILALGSFGGGIADKAPVIVRTIIGDVTRAHTVQATYSYTTDIVPPDGSPLSKPASGTSQLALSIGVTTVFPFPPAAPAVTQSIACSVRNLRLQLLPSPQIVEITVDEIAFAEASGAPSTFAVKGLHVNLSGALAFVQGLVESLGLGGWSIRPIDGAMLAAFNVKLGPLRMGAFAIDGLSFTSGLTLPFDGSEMRFVFGLASRLHPFTLMVGIFGGGGFVELDVLPSSKRLIVDAALQFQGGFALDLGVASGAVYVAAGIEIKIDTGKNEVILTGFVRCGGCLDVLGIISVSITFYIGLSYETSPAGSSAYGECEVIVEVHVLFFSASVSLRMRKQFAGSGGGQATPVRDAFSLLSGTDAVAALPPSRRFSDYVSSPQFAEYLSVFEV